MRITSRRRLDLFFLLVGAVAVGLVVVIGAFAYNEERIERMWVGAAIDADGTAALHEVIDYQFGNASDRHGLRRQIPGLTSTSPFSVTSPDAPDAINSITPATVDGEPGVDIKIGDANQTVSGAHRYVLDYRLGTLVEGGTIAWDAVGTGWQVRVEQAEIELAAPWALEDAVCQIGTTGSTETCEIESPGPGRLRVRASGIDPGSGVTVRATRGADLAAAPTLPEAPATPPDDPGAGIAQPAAVALVAALGAGLTTSRKVRRAGRERVGSAAAAGAAADFAFGVPSTTSEQLIDAAHLAEMATTEFAPPEELTAAMGGVIHAEQVRDNHKVAWLIEAAIEGAVDLQEEGGRTVRIVRLAPGDADTRPILDAAFAGRTAIELGSYDPRFAAGWAQLDTALETWSKSNGLWDPAGDRRRIRVRVLGALLGTIGLGIAGVGGAMAGRWGAGWMALVAAGALVAGVGWSALLRGWELRVRTPAGSGLWLRVESFRRFLAASEAYHADEAAKRGVLREYTAWAVALDELDHWKRAVQASTVIPESAGLGYLAVAPLLASSTSQAATAPSSSGSGGGGGGGVGGGGGGGGGGSW